MFNIKFFKKKTTWVFASFFLITPFLLLQLPGKGQGAFTQAGFSIAQSDLSNQRQEIAENFLDLLFNQQYEAATQYISPTLQSEFPPDVLRQKVEDFQQETGAFVSRLDSQVEGEVVVVKLQFERGERTFIVSFDENLNVFNANYVLETNDSTP